MTTKSCGSCTLCCKIMAVEAVQKPRNQWCTHCDKTKGCTIYETRPETCATFECLWLASQVTPVAFGPELRPDRSKVVLVPAADESFLIAHEDPGYPGAARRGPMGAWIKRHFLSRGGKVVIANGNRRTAINFLPKDDEWEETAVAIAGETP
jgi:hypothetical protein